MYYTCLSDIALFINGIETVKAYRFRVAITIYAVDSVFCFFGVWALHSARPASRPRPLPRFLSTVAGVLPLASSSRRALMRYDQRALDSFLPYGPSQTIR